VLFQENRPFDHYFGKFPGVNGFSPALLRANPNTSNPHEIPRSQALTCSPRHDYQTQQLAMNRGALNRFNETTGAACPRDPGLAMGYFDDSTVTALWNYAERFTLADNFHVTGIGGSTPGHLNLVAGNTAGATPTEMPNPSTPGLLYVSQGTVVDDPDPAPDMCSGSSAVTLSGRNVGDLLNARNVTWGWFHGGFADCNASHRNIGGDEVVDYIPHHEPFQYWPQTANPRHLPPRSPRTVGRDDRANHQYDIRDFWRAADAGVVPAVSFFKPPAYQDAHAGYSDPGPPRSSETSSGSFYSRWGLTACVPGRSPAVSRPRASTRARRDTATSRRTLRSRA
jgi:phospholipase C